MRTLLFLLVLIVALGCEADPDAPSPNDEPSNDTLQHTQNDTLAAENGDVYNERPNIDRHARSVMYALAEPDWQRISEEASDDGVWFVPYGYIDPTEHKRFSPDEIAAFPDDTTTYTWGRYDGKGNPIERTVEEYYDRFIFDYDYREAEQATPNVRVGHGNSLMNIEEFFGEEAVFVEFHQPGTEEYDGMDWSSLRLVFLPEATSWELVAIIHDQWTI